MSIPMRTSYDERKSSGPPLLDLMLLSLLAHATLFTLILLISAFTPLPQVMLHKPASQTVSLSLIPPIPQKPIFVPTQPEAHAPHKPQLVESANDHDLTTQSKTARKPDAIMPDVVGKEHASDLNNSPNAPSLQKPEVSSTPPTPRQAKPEKPTPPQLNPQEAQPPPPKPPQPTPKQAPPTPPQKPLPQVDENGLPVLPPIVAPTMAPPNSATQPLAPDQAQPQEAASIHGALGRHGDSSPAAMATVLGKYKQKVYEAVGSYWYRKVDNSFQVLGIGVVHIQFTIHSDGTVETKVLDGGDSTTQLLLSISINSIREAAPYDSFDKYPGLREEIMKQQGGDGSSYTDDFTFSIYGH